MAEVIAAAIGNPSCLAQVNGSGRARRSVILETAPKFFVYVVQEICHYRLSGGTRKSLYARVYEPRRPQ